MLEVHFLKASLKVTSICCVFYHLFILFNSTGPVPTLIVYVSVGCANSRSVS